MTLHSDFATSTKAELHVYADGTSGDDANDGLSAATPKKTLQAVLDLVPDIVKHDVVVHVSGITSGGVNKLLVKIAQGKYVVIDGGIATTTIVADDGGSPWAADIVSTTSIGLTTAGWTPDQYAGYWVEILDGPAVGQTRLIQGHDATTITPARDFSTSPGAGAAFRIVRPTTELASAFLLLRNNGQGSIATQGLYLTGTSYITTVSSSALTGDVFSHILINGTGSGYSGIVPGVNSSSSCRGAHFDADTVAYINAVTSSSVAVSAVGSATASFQAFSVGRLALNSCYFKNLVKFSGVGPGRPQISLGSRLAGGLYADECNGENAQTNIATVAGYATTKFGGVGIKMIRSSFRIDADVDISGSSTHAIECDNSRLHLDGVVTGGTNTGAGVYAHSGSVVHTKSGSPPTITGAVGDLAISDPAFEEETWANIESGTKVAIVAEMTMAKKVA